MPPTPATTTDPRMVRALAFERAMHAAVGRVVTTAWGQVFLDASVGQCYERNQAWAIGDAAGRDAVALDRDLSRLFRGARLAHRRLLAEPPAADRVGAGLAALGYRTERHLYMAFAGDAPAPPRAPVREVGVEAVVAANDRYLSTDPDTPYGRDDAVRAQLLEHHRGYGKAGADERRFAVLDDRGNVAAWAKLWTRDGAAQVEDVVCLAEHRGRGYGRDVVAAATRAALADDPELLFIVADDDDWPKALYRRIGFAAVGRVGVFTRHEPSHPWATAVVRPQSAGRGSRRRPPA
jgi:ribosomal protein S18 acetylase RimI-like enzyme